MTEKDFLSALSRVAVGGLVLATGLRFGLGERWFGFYGWATLALVALPFLARLLWRRLPSAGLSRWWTLAAALPVALAAAVQIGFWWTFFTTGPSDPGLGVVRAVLRPFLDSVLPWAGVLLALSWAYLLMRAGRPGRA